MGLAPFVRNELIERADEIVRVARATTDGTRSKMLRKAAKTYREATLGLMAKTVEKEADDWDIWFA